MNSANGLPFEWVLDIFRHCEDIDETIFNFTSDDPDYERFLGCLTDVRPNKLYWAGYCDLPDGFDAATADELFDAPIYDGKSLKERWGEVNLLAFGWIEPDEYISRHQDDYPIDAYR